MATNYQLPTTHYLPTYLLSPTTRQVINSLALWGSVIEIVGKQLPQC